MPRYCAVKGCRNRGGTASRQDHKRISFYPFPLQDKSRLQKWVGNMNRRGWTPSRHQYLCSEHFTENCFDIRWGIRYLKQTAIPTIFNNDGEKNFNTNKQSPMITSSASEVGTEPREATYDSSTPLILGNSWKPAQRNERKDAAEPSETGERPLVSASGIIFQTELSETQVGGNRILARSDPKQHPRNKLHPKVLADSAIAELCCDADAATLTDTADLETATFFEENSAVCFSEERAPSSGDHISVDEHSYCRAEDTDKDQLWCKVLCLNAKIMELNRREQSTVAKIQALEKEITLLQRDANGQL